MEEGVSLPTYSFITEGLIDQNRIQLRAIDKTAYYVLVEKARTHGCAFNFDENQRTLLINVGSGPRNPDLYYKTCKAFVDEILNDAECKESAKKQLKVEYEKVINSHQLEDAHQNQGSPRVRMGMH